MTGIRPDQFYGLPGQGMSLPQWLVDPITDDEMAMRYPGTFGDPASGPLVTPGMFEGEDAGTRFNRMFAPQSAPMPAAPPPVGVMPSVATPAAPAAMPAGGGNGLGWAARLLGGVDPLAGGIYNPQDARAAGRQALLAAGLNILQNSGPSPFRRSGLEIAAGGLQAGQQAYQQGVQSVAQRLQQAREMALKERGIATQEAFAAHQLLQGQNQPALTYRSGLRGANGQSVTRAYDRAGNQVGQDIPEAPTPRSSGDISERRFDYTIAKDWENRFLNPQRKAIEAYNLFRSHLDQARRGNPEVYKSLISAFAANADSFNQLRLGMLQYLSEINPSLAGKAEILFQKAQDGTIPPADLQRLADIVESNFAEIEDRYRTNWDELTARQPGTREYLTSPDALFHRAPQGRGGTRAPQSSGGANLNPITGRPRGQ